MLASKVRQVRAAAELLVTELQMTYHLVMLQSLAMGMVVRHQLRQRLEMRLLVLGWP